MAKLAMNKSTLQKERERLKLYQRVLPSLELKRRQLMVEVARAREALKHAREEIGRLTAHVGAQLPMLADHAIDVSGLVRIESADITEENIIGVRLPLLGEVQCTIQDYAMLAKPHWVDVLVDCLKEAVILQLNQQVMEERVKRLDYAVRRTTQRVNLFEKVLIPSAKKNIQRIRIFLGDAERAAIVRAKISKSKQKKKMEEM